MQADTLRAHIDAHPDIKTGKAIALIWTTDDLLELECGPDEHHPINAREAAEILQEIGRRHDATLGVTWDTLEDAIRNYLIANPRTVTRAEVAVGRGWGSHESGGWDLMPIELPTHQLEGLTDKQVEVEFERVAAEQLNERGEECVFLRTLAWELPEPDEDEEIEDAAA